MKVICLLCDSLNRHFLPFYPNDHADLGVNPAETPHMDWFAERSYVFDRHFSGQRLCS